MGVILLFLHIYKMLVSQCTGNERKTIVVRHRVLLIITMRGFVSFTPLVDMQQPYLSTITDNSTDMEISRLAYHICVLVSSNFSPQYYGLDSIVVRLLYCQQ